jgi:CIC family chloride channel protein
MPLGHLRHLSAGLRDSIHRKRGCSLGQSTTVLGQIPGMINTQQPPTEANLPRNEAAQVAPPERSARAQAGRHEAPAERPRLRVRRRHQSVPATLVGLGSGIVAVLFQQALQLAEGTRTSLLAHLHAFPAWGWLVLPVLAGVSAGLAGWLTSRFAPEASGSGIPHVKGVLMHVRSLNWLRVLPVKFVGGVLAIGAGLSLGREGPTVQMGAAVGKAVGDGLRLPRRTRGQLIAAGAGAGLAAAFNAPLAGFIFTIEELRRELSPLTYGPALIAAVVADVVTRTFTGQVPSFYVTGYPMPPLSALPLFAVVGGLAGLVGVVFNHSLLWTLRRFHSWTGIPVWLRAGLVGVVAGLVGWWLPQAIGGGHSTAEAVLRGQYAAVGCVAFLVVLFVAKLVMTIVSYGAGVPGGIFAPLLVLGSLVGLMTGQVSGLAFPEVARTPAAFAVVGMAAAFSSIVRAPLTGIVLILEMTSNYDQLLALLVACMVAFLVAERLGNKPIYEALLEYDLSRRGVPERPDATEAVTLELAVESRSWMEGRRVDDLGLPPGCLVVTVARGVEEVVPQPDTRLQAGDRVRFVVSGRKLAICATLSRRAKMREDLPPRRR